MGLMLGIDTGGTFTDAVVVGERREIVAAAKQLTTRYDLTVGISRAIDSLPSECWPTSRWCSVDEAHYQFGGRRQGSPVCALLVGYETLSAR